MSKEFTTKERTLLSNYFKATGIDLAVSLQRFKTLFCQYMESTVLTQQNYEAIYQEAKSYALLEVGELQPFYQAYKVWFGSKTKNLKTAEEQLGARIHSSCVLAGNIYRYTMRKNTNINATLKEKAVKHINGNAPIAEEPLRIHENSLRHAYRLWVENNDFIPADDVLAHFSFGKFVPNTCASARSNLRKFGYEFEQVELGWKVTKRPLKANITKADVLTMLQQGKLSREELIDVLLKL